MGRPCLGCKDPNPRPYFVVPLDKTKLARWCHGLGVKIPDEPDKWRICKRHFSEHQVYVDKSGHHRVRKDQSPHPGFYNTISPYKMSFCESFINCEIVGEGGGSVMANKSLLAALSPFLRTLLLTTPHCSPATLIIPDICGQALKHLTEFSYTGKVAPALSREELRKIEEAYVIINGGETFRIRSNIDRNMLTPVLQTPDPLARLLDQSPLGPMVTPVMCAPAPVPNSDHNPVDDETPELRVASNEELEEWIKRRQKTQNAPVQPQTSDVSDHQPQPTSPPQAYVINNDSPGERCAVCHEGGGTLHCERCPLVFHMGCYIPSLTSEPNDDWTCDMCLTPTEIHSVGHINSSILTSSFVF